MFNNINYLQCDQTPRLSVYFKCQIYSIKLFYCLVEFVSNHFSLPEHFIIMAVDNKP